MSIQIVRSTRDDALSLAERLRESDLEEIMAASGSRPLPALLRGLLSDECWTALVDGQPEAMFGVGGEGCAWLLGSGWMLTKEARRPIWKVSTEMVSKWQENYPQLFNWVDDRNAASRRWLERLGFMPAAEDPTYGVAKLPFTLWMRTRSNRGDPKPPNT